MENAPQKSFRKGLLQLIAISFGIWFLIWQVTPILVRNFPALAHYGKVAKDNDIMPGVLYYNDVPITVDAEIHTRNAVRFSNTPVPSKEKDEE